MAKIIIHEPTFTDFLDNFSNYFSTCMKSFYSTTNSLIFDHLPIVENYNLPNCYWMLTYNEILVLSKQHADLIHQVWAFSNQFFIFNNIQNITVNHQLLMVLVLHSYLFIYFSGAFMVFLFLFKYLSQHLNIRYKKELSFNLIYEKFLLFWVNTLSHLFESYEEALVTFVFWPWAIWLVFTHLTNFDNHEIFFIFVEWGLPVLYGYSLIIEHTWNFAKYLFTYLNGTRGKSILVITLLEDLAAFLIILARISLQIVRGLLCGFFHDFFRELSEYLLDSWELYYNYISPNFPFVGNSWALDLVLFGINWYLMLFMLMFIYVILFLQLVFLLIAVWLFCRCWFISKKPF